MSVKFTGDVERERIVKATQQRKAPTWEIFRSLSLVEALHFARDNGWAEKKVQVRFENTYSDVLEYIVEPYEEGCSCRSLLHYEDYFGTED